ncbi:Protein FANTASTIC FOUR 3 [Acorus calamus]|uniref:Protein FANTASTIC FOUR 3 n=1 Tax=Acorus calamus TaxID=4465 RepID=A0AAV9D101_ACOCL|nr:Protein FANTASTIC FOUR 3 [Acorus calamus]
MMSEESLAMCTEGLGCETGVVYVDEDMLGTLSPPPSPFLRQQRPPKVAEREFPPPMKSIEAVKYVKHREGERLVVKAVRASTMLKADRSGGRVRLCYLKCVDVPPPMEEKKRRRRRRTKKRIWMKIIKVVGRRLEWRIMGESCLGRDF